VPRDRGVQGVNLAFIGRPEQYHTPLSTPAKLDRGSLQHIGSQTLETAALMASAEALPPAGGTAVWADVFGRVVIVTTPAAGWIVLGLAALLIGFVLVALGRREQPRPGEVGRGALDGLWFLSVAVVAAHAVRALGGPSAARAEDAETSFWPACRGWSRGPRWPCWASPFWRWAGARRWTAASWPASSPF